MAVWPGLLVALRKESVDRNSGSKRSILGVGVALRKESVDRNDHHNLNLPSRPVALRKESVDRNYTMQIVIVVMHGRSPQGERG